MNPNATSSATSIYVVDTNDDRVVRFDRTGGTSEVWASGSGSADGEFSAPQGIALDKQGNVYVADTGNDRIEKFDSGGSFLSTWDGSGTQAGMLSSPQGIAVDYYTGDVYVADTGNNRIVKFDSGGSFLTMWDGSTSGVGALSSPQGITVGTDLATVVYVADTGNDRVVKFDGAGTLLATIGTQGSGEGEFNAPQGVAIDVANASALYVADTGNDRIEEFASAYEEPTVANQFLTSWGSGDGAFSSPQGVVEGFDVYVADSGNDRVERFGSPTADLSVIEDGTGSGEVSSTPSGLQCGNTCVASFNTDATVTLVATPDTGSIFVGWGGDCSGMDCTVTMDTAKSVTASFGSGFAVSPSSLDFGAVPLGQTKDLKLTIGNGTANPISLSPLVVVNQLPPQPFDAFVLYQGNLPYCGGITSLQPGETCGLTVRFWSVSNADDASPATLRVFDGTGNDVLATVPLIGATTSPRPTDAPNQAPHAVDDTIFALHDVTHSFDVLHNDSDPDADALSILDASQPLHGTVDLPFDRCSGAGVSPRSDCIRYTPYAGYTGPDQFTYTISDGRGLTDTAMVRILVQPASPSVADVTPAQGPSTGGRDITVSGDNFFSGGTSFNPVVSLVCGGQSYAAATTFVSEHQLTAISPSVGTFVGPCDVQVSNPGGSGSGTLPNGYTYGSTSVTFALTVSDDPASTGGGSITSNPGSIDCPGTCSDIFDEGSQVTLTATPAAGSTFTGWGGDCAGTGPCIVTMNDTHSVTATFSAIATELPPPFLLTWGSSGTGDGQFSYPNDVAVDGSGNVYVADTQNDRIEKFDADGRLVTTWGSYGGGNDNLAAPSGITVDGSGNVWVADTSNHRIQEFDASGRLMSTIGSYGTADGQFVFPSDVAVDGSGHVWVTDNHNSRVEEFGAATGQWIRSFGSNGSANGKFDNPNGIAVDGSGVYVADTGNGRIEKFDTNGQYLRSFGAFGHGNGLLSSPYGVTVDGTGNVYVANTSNYRIEKFNAAGHFVTNWGSYGSGHGQFSYPDGVAVDGSGNVYVADTINHRIQKFGYTYNLSVSKLGGGSGTVMSDIAGISCGTTCSAPYAIGAQVTLTATPAAGSTFTGWGGDCAGTGPCIVTMNDTHSVTATFSAIATELPPPFLLTWGSSGTGDGQFSYPNDVAVDGSGNVYVADTQNDRIEKFDADGRLVTTWGSYGGGNDNLAAPSGITVDGSGNVWVADTSNHRIQEFDASGRLMSTIGSYGTADGQFVFPSDVAVDGSGHVWVTDNHNSRVEEFGAATGQWIRSFGSNGSANGKFDNPNGIAVDGSGVYVADTGNGRIEKFDTNGQYLRSFGAFGHGNGLLSSPYGVTVDGTGNVYVANTSNYRIEKFNAAGHFVTNWGSYGSGHGQFSYPDGVAVDGSGNVYVADTINHRIQKFGYTYNLSVSKLGGGSGTVMSDIAGISCGTTCSAPYAIGAQVTLTATPAAGSTFTGWGGDCAGTGPCIVTMNDTHSVTATFSAIRHTLTVKMSGTGTGSVTSYEFVPNIYCAPTCSADYDEGSTVTLLPAAAPGSVLAGWSSNCTVVGDYCQITVMSDVTVTATFSSTKIGQTITFPAIPKKTMLQSGFSISPSASSGLPVTVTSGTTSICDISQGTVVLFGPGTCVLHADQAGNAAYNPAPTVTRTFSIRKVNQTIGFAGIQNITMLQSGVGISPIASSGLPVTVSSTTPSICTVNVSATNAISIHVVAPGTCSVDANQAGNAAYNPAPTVTRTFSIRKVNQTIAFAGIPNTTMSQSYVPITPSASSGLPVTVSSTTPSICTINVSPTNAISIRILGPGTCSVDANQAGNAAYNPAPTVTRTFSIRKVNQTIAFAGIPNTTMSQSYVPITPSASSGLPVTVSSTTASICTINVSPTNAISIRILGPGTCSVDANQAGNAIYNPAPTVTRSFIIKP